MNQTEPHPRVDNQVQGKTSWRIIRQELAGVYSEFSVRNSWHFTKQHEKVLVVRMVWKREYKDV